MYLLAFPELLMSQAIYPKRREPPALLDRSGISGREREGKGRRPGPEAPNGPAPPCRGGNNLYFGVPLPRRVTGFPGLNPCCAGGSRGCRTSRCPGTAVPRCGARQSCGVLSASPLRVEGCPALSLRLPREGGCPAAPRGRCGPVLPPLSPPGPRPLLTLTALLLPPCRPRVPLQV